MGSNSPSAACSCSPGDPPIVLTRSCSTSNSFFVAMDDWLQGFVPSPGTLVRHVGPPRLLIPQAGALTQPLRPFCTFGLAPGIQLGVSPGQLTIPDVDGAAFTAEPSSDRPCWGPGLQGLHYGVSVVRLSSSAGTSLTTSPFFPPPPPRPLPFLSLSLSFSLSGLGPHALFMS